MTNPFARRKQAHQFKEPARTDPYRSTAKPKGTPRCPECSSVVVRGRWTSTSKAFATSEMKCPSCKQLKDHFAMGVVELHGERWKKNKEQLMNTIHRTEKIARNRNDQERVISIKEAANVTKIYVTLPGLAQHIGRVLEKSFQGFAEYKRSTEEPYIRVRWWSDLPHRKGGPGAPLIRKKRNLSVDQEKLSAHKSKAFRGRSRKLRPGLKGTKTGRGFVKTGTL